MHSQIRVDRSRSDIYHWSRPCQEFIHLLSNAAKSARYPEICTDLKDRSARFFSWSILEMKITDMERRLFTRYKKSAELFCQYSWELQAL